MCDSVWPHRWQPTRLSRPWDSPGKNTGVGCHFLLQCMKVKNKVKSLSHVQLLATPWTAAHQAPPSMGFSRQEYWSGLPLPSPLFHSKDIYLFEIVSIIMIWDHHNWYSTSLIIVGTKFISNFGFICFSWNDTSQMSASPFSSNHQGNFPF